MRDERLNRGKKERSTAAPGKRQGIHFDEREDVIASLDLLGLLVSEVDKNPHYWKWVIIAAQSALQGSLVCTLSGTAGIGALRKDLQEKWLDWFDHGSGPAPDARLESFKTLLEWACDRKRMANSEAVPSSCLPPKSAIFISFTIIYEINSLISLQSVGPS
jgi:hypothetical protein